MNFSKKYLEECIQICSAINPDEIEKMADLINSVRSTNGRIFFLGVGGGAGHASHAVNDFRKICNIESYAPTDNVSELTARVNDDGWDTCYVNWLNGLYTTIVGFFHRNFTVDETAQKVESKKEIDIYLSYVGKNILKSAGCYQVEKDGPNIIENITGDFFNVMGFPLFPFLVFLKKFNVKK